MPYSVADGLPQEDLTKAEEIATNIISHMQGQVAEQTGVGVQHPYACGRFDVEHSKDGCMFVAQLMFYPSSTDGGGSAKPRVLEKVKSEVNVVDALKVLRHFVDPTRLEYLFA